MAHLLMTLAADPAPAGGGWGSMLPMLLIVFAIFYFVLFRPQSRERKEREQKIQSLKKNTKVVTNAGIHGTVVATDEDTVTLRVDDKNQVRIRFSKAAIWQVLDGSESKGEAKGSGKGSAERKAGAKSSEATSSGAG